jgi:hypothetical protein
VTSAGNLEHLAEIADILAAGVMRALARKSSGNKRPIRECSLDFSLTESGHAVPMKRGASHA